MLKKEVKIGKIGCDRPIIEVIFSLILEKKKLTFTEDSSFAVNNTQGPQQCPQHRK